ncbi:MAG: TlyA family RNA methyltransferase, partial [Thermodesulfovibrionales bacterium]
GGFTDCMLKKGVKKVYCIDVGYGQLSWRLREDPRVVLFEKTNIRYLERERIPDEIDFITIDVSFISLKKILPKAMEFLKAGGQILALIKPQFEVGRGEVGKGGVVRDEGKRMLAVEEIKRFSEEIGLNVSGIFQSPIKGPKGNIEYFIYLWKRQNL